MSLRHIDLPRPPHPANNPPPHSESTCAKFGHWWFRQYDSQIIRCKACGLRLEPEQAAEPTEPTEPLK